MPKFYSNIIAITGGNEEEKEEIDIEFNDRKVYSENNENMIDFRWSDVQGEDKEDISLVNIIESFQ